MPERNGAVKDKSTVKTGALDAIRILAAYHDQPVDDAELARRLTKPADEVEIDDLIRLLDDLGLPAKLAKWNWRRLARSRHPVIMVLEGGRFVVCLRCEEDKAVVQLPQMNAPKAVPRGELERLWTGEVVVSRPQARAAAQTDGFGMMWFLSTLKRYRGIVRDILLASFFVQLFALVTPLMFQIIIDKVLTHRSMSTLDVLMLALVTVSIFEVVLGGLRHYAVAHTSSKLDVELGARLFQHLLLLPMSFYKSRQVGELIARIRELDTVRAFLTGSAVTLVIDVFFTFVFLAVMFYYSPKLTFVVLVAIPLFLGISFGVAPLLRKGVDDQFAVNAANQSFLVETVGAMETIKSGVAEPQMQREWERRLAEHVKTALDNRTVTNVSNQLTNLVSKGAVVVVLWLGTKMVMEGELTVGQLIAFNMLTARVNAPILRIANLWQDFQQLRVSLRRLAEVLDAPTEPLHMKGKTNTPIRKGHIEFRDVSFRYDPDGPEIIHDLTLEIEPGEVIGIVGSSGSGKTTMVKLLQRLYVPTRGRILIDGMDINLMDAAMLRKAVGVVPQDAAMFNRSVRDNIAIGNPLATNSEIVAAAQLAGAHNFISGLPEAYDTVIGEGGKRLSAGQRQRIAIARALLGRPRILVLDEATSALDSESEFEIQKNMRRICENRTVLVIAHRLATVRSADRIVILENGGVVESGNHEALIGLNGRYARLHALQEGLNEVA